jgi:hypothetical protein
MMTVKLVELLDFYSAVRISRAMGVTVDELYQLATATEE